MFLFIFLSAAGNQKKQKGKARQKRVRFHGQNSYLVSFSRDNGNKCIKNCPKWRLSSVFNIVFSFSRYHSRHDDEVPYRIRTELALFVNLLSQTDLPDLSHLSTALDHRSREKVSHPLSKFPRPLAYPAATLSKKTECSRDAASGRRGKVLFISFLIIIFVGDPSSPRGRGTGENVIFPKR